MSKTPVMVLQEVAMKRCSSLPVYTEISCIQGTHQNKFTIGVKWKSYDAKGVGSSKMKAKHNAAQKMLALLVASSEISQNQVSLISCHEAATTTVRPTNSATSTTTMFTSVLDSGKSFNNSSISLPCSPVSAASLGNAFVNYVGLLHEYCASRHIPEPQYDIVNRTGPSHLPVFIMSCRVASVHEQVSATTKKNAKHEVAKKVLQQLTKDTDFGVKNETLESCVKKLNAEFMNLQISEPKVDDSQTVKVLTTYTQLKHKSPVITHAIKIENYHAVLSSLCYRIPKIERDSLINIFKTKTYFTQNISDVKNIICSAMDTTMQTIAFKANIGNQFIIGLRLCTYPTILKIGIGETTERAERHALCKLFAFIAVLLK
ncbi:RISC-loading complex subunit tarbp2-like [Andrena cerasifolii]|uniref:RISC-loading complex subunit tarbp2-like n=1 Tax=Andrena cerasifolii TaxID=2819439 RepID=UPI0040384221